MTPPFGRARRRGGDLSGTYPNPTVALLRGVNGGTASEYSLAIGRSTASGFNAIAMGGHAEASGQNSVAIGDETTAGGHNALAMGGATRAFGDGSTAMGELTFAYGLYSTSMGFRTVASGDNTTAMGRYASTNDQLGSFVYGDASTADWPSGSVRATAPNSFVVRAQRVWFGTTGDQVATAGRYIETSTGAYLSDAGMWTNVSDRDRKHDLREVDGDAVLRKIAALPIHDWAYNVESPSIRHIGPTAQDFYAAFRLGDNERAIGSLDIDGVNMLAIQALERRTRELREQLEVKDREIAVVRTAVVALMHRLERLERER